MPTSDEILNFVDGSSPGVGDAPDPRIQEATEAAKLAYVELLKRRGDPAGTVDEQLFMGLMNRALEARGVEQPELAEQFLVQEFQKEETETIAGGLGKGAEAGADRVASLAALLTGNTEIAEQLSVRAGIRQSEAKGFGPSTAAGLTSAATELVPTLGAGGAIALGTRQVVMKGLMREGSRIALQQGLTRAEIGAFARQFALQRMTGKSAQQAVRTAATLGTSGMAGLQGGAPAYFEARQAGLPADEALQFAIASGGTTAAVTSAFGFMGLGGAEMLSRAGGVDMAKQTFRQMLKTAGKQAVGEITEENIDQIFQIMIRSAQLGEDKSLIEVLEELGQTSIIAGILGAGVPLAQAGKDVAQAQFEDLLTRPSQPTEQPTTTQQEVPPTPGEALGQALEQETQLAQQENELRDQTLEAADQDFIRQVHIAQQAGRLNEFVSALPQDQAATLERLKPSMSDALKSRVEQAQVQELGEAVRQTSEQVDEVLQPEPTPEPAPVETVVTPAPPATVEPVATVPQPVTPAPEFTFAEQTPFVEAFTPSTEPVTTVTNPRDADRISRAINKAAKVLFQKGGARTSRNRNPAVFWNALAASRGKGLNSTEGLNALRTNIIRNRRNKNPVSLSPRARTLIKNLQEQIGRLPVTENTVENLNRLIEARDQMFERIQPGGELAQRVGAEEQETGAAPTTREATQVPPEQLEEQPEAVQQVRTERAQQQEQALEEQREAGARQAELVQEAVQESEQRQAEPVAPEFQENSADEEFARLLRLIDSAPMDTDAEIDQSIDDFFVAELPQLPPDSTVPTEDLEAQLPALRKVLEAQDNKIKELEESLSAGDITQEQFEAEQEDIRLRFADRMSVALASVPRRKDIGISIGPKQNVTANALLIKSPRQRQIDEYKALHKKWAEIRKQEQVVDELVRDISTRRQRMESQNTTRGALTQERQRAKLARAQVRLTNMRTNLSEEEGRRFTELDAMFKASFTESLRRQVARMLKGERSISERRRVLKNMVSRTQNVTDHAFSELMNFIQSKDPVDPKTLPANSYVFELTNEAGNPTGKYVVGRWNGEQWRGVALDGTPIDSFFTIPKSIEIRSDSAEQRFQDFLDQTQVAVLDSLDHAFEVLASSQGINSPLADIRQEYNELMARGGFDRVDNSYKRPLAAEDKSDVSVKGDLKALRWVPARAQGKFIDSKDPLSPLESESLPQYLDRLLFSSGDVIDVNGKPWDGTTMIPIRPLKAVVAKYFGTDTTTIVEREATSNVAKQVTETTPQAFMEEYIGRWLELKAITIGTENGVRVYKSRDTKDDFRRARNMGRNTLGKYMFELSSSGENDSSYITSTAGLIEKLGKLFNVPITVREGKGIERGLGVRNRVTGAVVLGGYDIDTAIHEVGHDLHMMITNDEKAPLPPSAAKEFRQFAIDTQDIHNGPPLEREGVAEFLVHYFANRTEAAKKYPEAAAWWEGTFDSLNIRDQVDTLQKYLDATRSADPGQRAQAQIITQEDARRVKLDENKNTFGPLRSWMLKLYDRVFDRQVYIRAAVSEMMGRPRTENIIDDPSDIMRLSSGFASQANRMLETGFDLGVKDGHFIKSISLYDVLGFAVDNNVNVDEFFNKYMLALRTLDLNPADREAIAKRKGVDLNEFADFHSNQDIEELRGLLQGDTKFLATKFNLSEQEVNDLIDQVKADFDNSDGYDKLEEVELYNSLSRMQHRKDMETYEQQLEQFKQSIKQLPPAKQQERIDDYIQNNKPREPNTLQFDPIDTGLTVSDAIDILSEKNEAGESIYRKGSMFDKMNKQFQQFNLAFDEWRLKHGDLTRAEFFMHRLHKNYMPLRRFAVKSQRQAIKGSGLQIIDPLQSTIQKVFMASRRVMHNKALNAYFRVGLDAQIHNTHLSPSERRDISNLFTFNPNDPWANRSILNEELSRGQPTAKELVVIRADERTASQLVDNEVVDVADFKGNRELAIASTIGRPLTYQLPNEDVRNGLMFDEMAVTNKAWGILTIPANLQRKFLTQLNPAFIVRSFFRDIVQSRIQTVSRTRVNTAKDAAELAARESASALTSLPAFLDKEVKFYKTHMEASLETWKQIRSGERNTKSMPLVNMNGKKVRTIKISDSAELFNQFVLSGASRSSFYAEGVPMDEVLGGSEVNRVLTQLGRAHPKKLGWLKSVTGLNFVEDAAETTEQNTRFAEFRRIFDREVSGKALEDLTEAEIQEALTRAGRSAQEITLDFNRAGRWVRNWNRFVPFFNAGMQGIDKTVRVLMGQDPIGSGKDRSNPLRNRILASSFVTMFLAAPAALQFLLVRSLDVDEDFEEIPEQQRLLYWFVPIPKGEGEVRQRWLKVPKPPGTWAGIMRGFENIFQEDPIEGERVAEEILSESMPPAWLPTTIEFAMNIAGHESENLLPLPASKTRGSGILSQRLNRLSSEFQDSGSTSPSLIAFTDALREYGGIDLSAAHLQYMMRSYTGGLGMIGYESPDFLRTFIANDERASREYAYGLGEFPVVRSFLLRDPAFGSRTFNEFYRMYEATQEARANVNEIKRRVAEKRITIEQARDRIMQDRDLQFAFKLDSKANQIADRIRRARIQFERLDRDPDLSVQERNAKRDEFMESIIESISSANAAIKEVLEREDIDLSRFQ